MSVEMTALRLALVSAAPSLIFREGLGLRCAKGWPRSWHLSQYTRFGFFGAAPMGLSSRPAAGGRA